MMYPTADDSLAAIIETFERDIAPLVDDEYGSSLCLTVGQMLRSVRTRVALEGQVLDQDNHDLRALLTDLRGEVPASLATAIDATTTLPADQYRPLEELQSDAADLRRVLEACISAIPDRTSDTRAKIREYLTRHLERQQPWLINAFTGPRR
jgi:hypothetical protein